MASSRRLAAIMFTDTVGYTASAQAEESRTLDLLRQQSELIRPIVALHQGREVKSTGDGFLVEFDSALKATLCAVNVQRRLYERNSEGDLPPIQIRIGIHLGDVVPSGRDILGDAVNIAARIEPLAEPGGICISGAVHDQVRNKIPEKLEKLPPARLKGVQLPIDIFRVVLPWHSPVSIAADAGSTRLAVLPFTNISPDPKDEYLADGLTEELISVLSQLRGLRVIARTSVMSYKSTPKNVSQVGAELGVSHILEGSVRKAGDELRITAQLIDVSTQAHRWATSYDRKLDGVFALQADIAKQVAGALRVELGAGEVARLDEPATSNPDSYLAYLRGRTLMHSRSPAALKGAQELFERAISLDAKNAAAYSGLADVHWLLSAYAGAPWPAGLEASRRAAERAIELDPNQAEAHGSFGNVLRSLGQLDRAEAEYKLALTLNPSSATVRHGYCFLLEDTDRVQESLQQAALALELDPLSVPNHVQPAALLVYLGRFEEAYAHIEQVRQLEPSGAHCQMLLWMYFDARSEFDRAFQHLELFCSKLPGDPLIPALYAEHFARTHQESKALEFLERAKEAPDELMGKNSEVAIVYSLLGDLNACFLWLNRARKNYSLELNYWRLSPLAADVRKDPRFQELLRSYQFP